MASNGKTRQQGVVLLAVVWTVVVLTAMALGLASLVRTGSEELRARKERLQAYYLARGAVYRAIPALKQWETQTQPDRPAGLSRLEWSEDTGRVTVEVMDEGGRIDLNTAPAPVLEKLFLNFGMEYMAAHNLVAAIGDWRDADDDTRLGGAESLYYLGLPKPYRPANHDFQSVDELLLVRGVTPQMFYGGYQVSPDGSVERRLGLADCLTVATRTTMVNINYAPEAVLLALPRMEPSVVRYIVDGRQKRMFKSVSEFTREYPVMMSDETLNYLSTGSSGVYSLIASGRTAGGITARVRATVRVAGLDRPAAGPTPAQPGPPFLIMDWDDSYVR
jgi:general secretion pathway protein K